MGRQRLIMEYENPEIIEAADNASKCILDQKSRNHVRDKFFPKMIDALGLKSGVEIGVDKGDFANHILNASQIGKYYCVDTWQNDFGSDHRPDAYDKDGDNRFNGARTLLQGHINDGRTSLLRMTSMAASTFFPKESLDFCYIDGDHSLEGIYMDLKAWIPKIRIGGIIAGHDYKDGHKSGINDYFGEQLDFHVKTAVDYFCRRYGYKLNVTGGLILSWWFVKNHHYVDTSEAHFLTNSYE